MTTRFLIIVSAADRGRANAVAKGQFDSVGGDKTFLVGLSADGKEPASHYWCSAVFSGSGVEKLYAAQAEFTGAVVQPYDADADPGFPQRAIAGLGLKQIVKFPEVNPFSRE